MPFLSRGLTLRAGQALTPPARVFSMEAKMAATKKTSRLQDTQAFRAMWSAGVPSDQIGKVVGLAASSVNNKAKMFGYPSRGKSGALYGPMPSYPAVDAPVVKDEPEEIEAPVQTHPRRPVEYDAAIIKTGGKYSDIASLAKTIDRSVNAILGRWHQLRVM